MSFINAKLVKSTKALAKKLWSDESAQGSMEYILVLIIAVGVALVFKENIKNFVDAKLNDLKGGLDGIKAQ